MAERTITVEAGTNVEAGHPAFDPDLANEDGIHKIKATVEFAPGDSLAEASEMFGEDLVYDRYVRQVNRDLGNAIRSSLNSNRTPDQVEAELADWRPDVQRTPTRQSADPVAAFKEKSPEDQQKLLAELMAIAEQANQGQAEPA